MHTPVAAAGTAVSPPPDPDVEQTPTMLPADAFIRRSRLRDAGLPCVLVVGEHEPPPVDCGPLEDWIRQPIIPSELALRWQTLRERHAATTASAVLGVVRTNRPTRRSSPLHAVHT